MISFNDFNNPKSLESFFINYLHIKGIYSIYMSNFKKHNKQNDFFNDLVMYLYDSKNIKGLFSTAFVWSDTEQGQDFWSEQNIEYIDYIQTSEILANCWED